MKLQRHFWALSLVLISILSSCKKNNSQPDQDVALKGTITAKIDGSSMTFPGAALKASGTASGTEGTIIFSTGVAGDKYLTFGVFASTITAGKTYNTAVNDDDMGAFIGYLTKEQVEAGNETGYVSTYDGTDGAITITSITNDNVQGTFKGTLRFHNKGTVTNQSVSVTEGKFNLTITNVDDIPGINGVSVSPFKNSLK